MFKSVFRKYFFAFMLIVLISFSIIILIISMIIGEYSKNEKNHILENAAQAANEYLESELAQGSGDLESLMAHSQDDVRRMMQVVASHEKDLEILIADDSGKVWMAVGNQDAAEFHGTTLPDSLLKEALGNGGGLITQSLDRFDLFDTEQIAYSAPLMREDGAVAGAVLICSSPEAMPELTTMISQTIVHSILWILVAVLIAVYFVTERILSPLRAISDAAKSFAKGKFDVRVPVRGRDEISELAVAINNMAESLDNYDTMRNTFLSNVSHDLRTPMTSIAGFIDGILDGVIPPEKHSYYLRLVSEEIKRLSRLVVSLLDLSRIQAGERRFTPTAFDICEMGREILISFEQKITEKRLNVEFSCDEENLNALADRDAIHQIFYNLCDNAVKFSFEEGLFRISIRKIKNRKLLVSVYNEGQGISDADLPYVFERFYKSDKSRGLNKSGVGLGLFISKTIVDAHGEKIWVESEFGKSCCFNFTLSCE